VVASMSEWGLPLEGKKVLMVCGLERLGMAEALVAAGAETRFGDLMFALGIGMAIKKLKTLHRLIAAIAPIISILPFKALYPSGSGQNKRDKRYARHYAWADVIAGDYLYIDAHLPDSLEGKVIVTNTVTPADVEVLKKRGVRALVTTAPEIEGRSYGTNVVEALLVAMSGVTGRPLTGAEYEEQIEKAGLKPRVEFFT
ncbi:MAG: quinate 5-dehydrogenase, partial [Clostridia bacterium]|nr:quinate 5-dehydrogenase [Clostridia bacterium]